MGIALLCIRDQSPIIIVSRIIVTAERRMREGLNAATISAWSVIDPSTVYYAEFRLCLVGGFQDRADGITFARP